MADGTDTDPADPVGDARLETADTERTFTQSEFTKALKEKRGQWKRAQDRALKEARATALAEVADRFGVDVDGIDEVASRLESTATVEQRFTALERQHKKLSAERDGLQDQLSSILQQRQQDQIKSAIYEGGKGKCNDLQILSLLLSEQIGVDESGSVFVRDDDGTPSGVTVEQLIESTLDEKPHLQAASSRAGGGSRPAGAPNTPTNSVDLSSPQGIGAELAKLFPGGVKDFG